MDKGKGGIEGLGVSLRLASESPLLGTNTKAGIVCHFHRQQRCQFALIQQPTLKGLRSLYESLCHLFIPCWALWVDSSHLFQEFALNTTKDNKFGF